MQALQRGIVKKMFTEPDTSDQADVNQLAITPRAQAQIVNT
jgi:hypothetical protein